MNNYLAYFVTAIIAYLLGSISFSIIISKVFFKKNIRDFGSKNAGGTNAIRVLGPVPGIIIILGDIGKGVLAVYLGKFVFSGVGEENMMGALIAGLFVIIGHVYPLYFKFKGGKGMATAAGMLIMVNPVVFLILFPIFILMILVFRYVSLASISVAAIFPVLTFFYNYYFNDSEKENVIILTIVALFIGAFIIYTHRSNIKRLLSGTESKVGRKKEKKDNE